MKRSRLEDLLGLRMGMLQANSDKEVFDAFFYLATPRTPDRNPAHAVRSDRWLPLCRCPLRPPGPDSAPRRTSHLASASVHAAADPLGLPQSSSQSRWLLSRYGGPRPRLAGRSRLQALLAQDRPLLQSTPTPTRVPAAPPDARDGTDLARRKRRKKGSGLEEKRGRDSKQHRPHRKSKDGNGMFE